MHPAEKELLMETVRTRGQCSVRVGGYCMKPAIHPGALLTIHDSRETGWSAGDILAFFIGPRLFAHRFIDRKAEKLILRSDSGRPDIHEIPEQDVLGKVTKIANPSFPARITAKCVNRLNKIFGGVHG